MEKKEKREEPALGTSYPVNVLVRLENSAGDRALFESLPRKVQLDILRHNTMEPEAIRRFLAEAAGRPSPLAGLEESGTGRLYLSTASPEVRARLRQEKEGGGGE